MVLARDLFVATADVERPQDAAVLAAVRELGYRPRLVSADEAAQLPMARGIEQGKVAPVVLTLALQRAQEREVPLLVRFHAAWCVPCQQMQRHVWSVPAVIKVLDRVELLEVDADLSPEVATWLGVLGLPDARLLSPAGKEIARLSGVIAWKDVVSAIEAAKAEVGVPRPRGHEF